MPFTWARATPSYLAFFGLDSTDDVATQVVRTLTVWIQFKGQI